MLERYPAKYTDAHGTEETWITNDGETLRMTIRGVEFSGNDFDSLSVPEAVESNRLASFTLCQEDLCACRIECEMPIPINDHGEVLTGALRIDVQLSEPGPKGWLEHVHLQLTLVYKGQEFGGNGKSGWFEDELNEIQSHLPDDIFMIACINCSFSDYSPYGHGMFGGMMCFRNVKEEYLKVTSKDELWSVHDRCECIIQETFLCDEFQRRTPGTGYRG